jgi:fibronectin-binding autotransporter adhesin
VSITETGGITTQGDDASGVIAVAGQGPVDLTLTGAISTQGGGSAGAVAVADYGAVNVQATKISTAGGGAPALAVYAFANTATVNIDTASTAGIKSPALLVEGQTGASITANQVTTSGDDSNAVIIRSGGYGVIGNATVNVGSITTTGQHSAGVDAFTVGQSLTGPSQASSLSITVGSITTTGIDSVGVSAINSYGALNITASSISTQGYESTGVLALGGGDISLQVGSISTGKADAIYANGSGSGTITIGVTGKVASTGANGIVAINAAGATNITVGSGGGISGALDGVQVQTGTGQVTITNAGTISGGAGYAIDVTALPNSTPASGAQISNTGTLVGAVNLAAGGVNLFTNTGVFEATKDSDFGGSAQFVNSGVLKILPGSTTPGTVSFLGLTTFENAGGLVDLRNGAAGDVFTLSGDYVASGNARLGLDVGAGVADKLVILGTASGATSILLGVNPASATLLAKPLTLVQAGAGSTATFTLNNPDIGLIHYGLKTDAGAAGAVDYDLTASAGAPVYGLLKLEQSAQTIWRQSADAWTQ